MGTSAKANIKINGKDYTTDEIIKNVSAFFNSNNNSKNTLNNINLGLGQKMIINSLLKSISSKGLSGTFNESLVAKIGEIEKNKNVVGATVSEKEDAENLQKISSSSPMTEDIPSPSQQVTDNSTTFNDTYKPIQVGHSPQIALLGVLLAAGVVTFFLLVFFGVIEL